MQSPAAQPSPAASHTSVSPSPFGSEAPANPSTSRQGTIIAIATHGATVPLRWTAHAAAPSPPKPAAWTRSTRRRWTGLRAASEAASPAAATAQAKGAVISVRFNKSLASRGGDGARIKATTARIGRVVAAIPSHRPTLHPSSEAKAPGIARSPTKASTTCGSSSGRSQTSITSV